MIKEGYVPHRLHVDHVSKHTRAMLFGDQLCVVNKDEHCTNKPLPCPHYTWPVVHHTIIILTFSFRNTECKIIADESIYLWQWNGFCCVQEGILFSCTIAWNNSSTRLLYRASSKYLLGWKASYAYPFSHHFLMFHHVEGLRQQSTLMGMSLSTVIL